MPNFASKRVQQFPNRTSRPRRLLILGGEHTLTNMRQQLAGSGYEIQSAVHSEALSAIEELAPDVALIEIRRTAGTHESESITLARQLRSEPATCTLPVVLLFHLDEPAVRNTALNIGADDYFSLATPIVEVRARLDALFWRIEAGRRVAPTTGEQRSEIDNFMLLLDSMRADLERGEKGSIALLELAGRFEGEEGNGASEQSRAISRAHGFFKLNLRRVDAVAFYGPTTLLVYLPGYEDRAARSALGRLREEFCRATAKCDVAIGIAAFPRDGSDIEDVIEKADSAQTRARAGAGNSRVLTYSVRETVTAGIPEPKTQRAELIGQGSAPQPLIEHQGRQMSLRDHVVRESKTRDSGEISQFVTPGGWRVPGPDAMTPDAALAATQERERRAQGAIMPKRLLLAISDGARMAQINLLMRYAGYDVRAAFDGHQALSLLRIERPDVLILDYDLSGINGVETLKLLRSQGRGRLMVPVVLLLPEGRGVEFGREAEQMGARPYVTMPYDPSKLLESVRLAGRTEW